MGSQLSAISSMLPSFKFFNKSNFKSNCCNNENYSYTEIIHICNQCGSKVNLLYTNPNVTKPISVDEKKELLHIERNVERNTEKIHSISKKKG